MDDFYHIWVLSVSKVGSANTAHFCLSSFSTIFTNQKSQLCQNPLWISFQGSPVPFLPAWVLSHLSFLSFSTKWQPLFPATSWSGLRAFPLPNKSELSQYGWQGKWTQNGFIWLSFLRESWLKKPKKMKKLKFQIMTHTLWDCFRT